MHSLRQLFWNPSTSAHFWLALLNDTLASTAFALEGLFAALELFAAAMVLGNLRVDAARGSRRPFDPLAHEVRGHVTL